MQHSYVSVGYISTLQDPLFWYSLCFINIMVLSLLITVTNELEPSFSELIIFLSSSSNRFFFFFRFKPMNKNWFIYKPPCATFTLGSFSGAFVLKIAPVKRLKNTFPAAPMWDPDCFHTGVVPLQNVRKGPASSISQAVRKQCVHCPCHWNQWAPLPKCSGAFNPLFEC